MKLHRFLVGKIEFVKNNSQQITLTDKENKELLNQILNVFRMRAGGQFILFDGSGTEYLVEMVEGENKSRKEVLCEIKEERQGLKRNKKLNLVFALIRKENTELVLQKCTEIGVTNFIPMFTERTVKFGWKRERLEKIVAEATEQSGWSDIPQIQEPEKLEKILEKFKKEKENLDGLCVLDFGGVQLSTIKHLISVDTIFVGPEGGFTDKERNLFKKYNIKTISLGPNTLRAETACISVSSIFLL